MAVSSVIEAASAESLWSPPGSDQAAIDGLCQSLIRSPSRSGAAVSFSRRDEHRDERRDERRCSSGDDVVSALVSKLRGKNETIAELQANSNPQP